MFRPHDRKHAQFSEGRRTAEAPLDLMKFRRGKSVGRSLVQIHVGLAGQGDRIGAHAKLWMMERKILRPPSPPSIGSTACSGCGIKPKTLKLSLATPAIECIEPLGLAASVASPCSST